MRAQRERRHLKNPSLEVCDGGGALRAILLALARRTLTTNVRCGWRERSGTVRPMAPSPLRYDVADGVATITLDQPETRNALSDELLDDLIARVRARRATTTPCAASCSPPRTRRCSRAAATSRASRPTCRSSHKHAAIDALPAPVPR